MRIWFVLAKTTAVLLIFGLTACTGENTSQPTANTMKKSDSAPFAQSPVKTEPEPAAPTVTIESFEVGIKSGSDYKLESPVSVFNLKDTIYASMVFKVVGTEEALPGNVVIKWLNIDTNTLVKEEKKDLPISNSNVLNLALDQKDGMVQGKYRVDVSFNGSPELTKNFEVK